MMLKNRMGTRFPRFLGWTLIVTCVALPVLATDNGAPPEPKNLTVQIGNRLYPNFGEKVTLEMHRLTQVGDTDYFFEIIEFYPHFAVTDSTKQFISLSDELKNPAFHIQVVENDSIIQTAWAFFNLSVPHFTRTSYLTFDVLSFEYQGTMHDKKATNSANKSEQADGGANQ